MHEQRYSGSDGWPLYAFATEARAAAGTGGRPPLILMHGGGPDHRSLVPLARRLADAAQVVLPDVRGYGRSTCADPARHTWTQYAADVVSLLDALEVEQAFLGGAGMGATIALRTAVAHPQRVRGLVLISIEDIEDDAAKEAETTMMESFAERMRTRGVEAAWEPILPDLSPVIGAMVREAMSTSDPDSLAAAAAIGRDRAFRSADELFGIAAPTLLFAGGDWRHPVRLAEMLAARLPRALLGKASMAGVQSIDEFGRIFAPEILGFLRSGAPPC